ncbi:MAG: RNA polymerase sigma factor [Planctomycetota bacterium]
MQTHSTPTRRLWEQARGGDRAAYDQLFALHRDRARLFVRSRLGEKLRQSVDSQDVMQDAYLAAHEDFDQFEWRDEGSFFRWLCRILENRIRGLGAHYGAQKRQAVPLPQLDPTGPLSRLDRSEHRERVARALDQLNEEHRAVLLCRFFEGLSAAETGERMERSEGAVGNLTARALVALGRVL